MKKLLTMLFLVTFLAGTSFAQLVNESFDGTTFPPTGWTQSSTSALTWARLTATAHPAGIAPHSGAGLAQCNSWTVNGGTSTLFTPVVSFTASPAYYVSFWMYRDAGYLTTADKVDVRVNTTASTTGATTIGTINRAIGLAPVVAAAGWYKYEFSIPGTFNGATNYVMFSGTSAYGNDIYIDDVTVAALTTPGVAVIGTPANAATGILLTATLNWTAPTTGGTPSGYKMYFGTNNPPTNLVNGTNLGNVLTYTPSPALNIATTYYWKVVPTNAAGDATGAPVWSFVTMDGYG